MATATATKNTPEAPKFQTTDKAPKFKGGRGRGKSALRVALEDLPEGNFLNAGPFEDKLEGRVRSAVSSIQTSEKGEGRTVKFTVRRGEDDNLWVGKLSN